LGVAGRCRRYFACLSLWYDEAYLLLNVFNKPFIELAGPLQEEQVAPPLFLFLLRGLYLLAGPGEWVLRLPSFLAGLAALFLMIPLAGRVAGPVGNCGQSAGAPCPATRSITAARSNPTLATC
jgi:hypothetical protein